MAAKTSVPVLLLTGFLGSGKTSLLARWLKAPEFAGAMVIVNELGEVGIDDRLVESSSETPLLLDNGCACCAAGEDLTATLERLFWDRLHRKIPKFSWVLIETTGVADPAPILDRLKQHTLVCERFHVEGVVTTFDARLGAAQLERHPECASQLQHADAVVLTKCDIADADELAAAHAAVTSVRPDARVLESSRSELSAADVIVAMATADRQSDGDARHAHLHSVHETHVHAVHSANVTTGFAALGDIVDSVRLQAALASAINEYGPALLRLKGIVRVAADGEWRVVQAMPGEGVTLSPAPTRIDQDMKPGMTVIAQNVPAQEIADAIVAHMRGVNATRIAALQKAG